MKKLVFYFCLLPALTSGCSGFDVLNAIVPQTGYQRTANLSYGYLARQKLDVYQPNSLLGGASIVIFFHGGYWQYGNKDEYRFVGQALSSKGFIAVLPNYRLYPQVTFPAYVEDGALAVRWAYDNALRMGGDPQHIYLMGHSAGAQIAALLTLDAHYLKAVGLDRKDIRATAALSGPYDFPLDDHDRAVFGNHSATQPVNPAIQAINFVDGHEPPMFLGQGGKDTTVNPNNATKLADRIRYQGGEVQVVIYPQRAHSTIVLSLATYFHWLAPVLDDTTRFFRSH